MVVQPLLPIMVVQLHDMEPTMVVQPMMVVQLHGTEPPMVVQLHGTEPPIVELLLLRLGNVVFTGSGRDAIWVLAAGPSAERTKLQELPLPFGPEGPEPKL